MKNALTCKDCPYCYRTKSDRFPCCHFEGEWDAPCEYEPEDEPEEDYSYLME